MRFLPAIKLNKQKALKLGGALLLLVGLFEPFLFPTPAHATAASGYVRLDRLAITQTGVGGLVCATPQTTGTEAKLVLTFPATGASPDATHFGVNQTASNWTLDTSSIPSGTTAWPGVGTNPTSVSGGAVTIASSDLTAATTYCFTWSGASTLSTNTTSAQTNLTGSLVTETSGNAAIDTINFALATVSNDQVAVTGSVSSTFSFSLGGNSAALGTIATASNGTSASAVTGTVSTNANNGWIAWVKSANAALSSPSTSDTISSASYTTGSGNIVDLSSATGYVLDVNTGTNSPTIATEYDGNTTAKGGNLSTSFQKIASQTAPASSSTFDLVVRARATATNKAASDYADTLTVTAAGQF